MTASLANAFALVAVHLEKLTVIVFLVSSMAAMGLTLTPRAIVAPLRDARFVLIALASNFVFAPGFAWLLTFVIPLERGHAAGLLLLGGAAGAPFLPKLVETARGNLAQAAALMALLTAGTILFLPFALPLMIPGMQSDPWSIARPLLLLIVLPLAAGVLVKCHADSLATWARPLLARIATVTLVLLFVLLIALNWRALLEVIGSGAILAAILYFAGLFIIAWLIGGPEPEERAVLGLATTARNFGSALVPATSSFRNPHVTIMIIVGAIVCLVVSFVAAGWARRIVIASRAPPSAKD
jgi:bile acid:Na+ symporter, BASS family